MKRKYVTRDQSELIWKYFEEENKYEVKIWTTNQQWIQHKGCIQQLIDMSKRIYFYFTFT